MSLLEKALKVKVNRLHKQKHDNLLEYMEVIIAVLDDRIAIKQALEVFPKNTRNGFNHFCFGIIREAVAQNLIEIKIKEK